MALEENDSSVQFSPDTKEESIPPASIEEGIPQSKNGSNLVQRQASRALSAVSKKYDVDGDGKLSEAEQAMRNLDTEGRGYLTNDKVLSVFQEQLRMQKQLLLAKRLLILFSVLLVILAVANIAVAFIAARLAKDTTTRNDVLIVKDTGGVVATNNHADVYGIQTSVDTERRAQVTGDGTTTGQSTTVGRSDAIAMYNECAKTGVSVKLKRTWTGYTLEDIVELCPGMSYSYDGVSKYEYLLMFGGAGRIADNRIIEIDCQGDPCSVTGNGLIQSLHEPCIFDSDCETNNCVKPIAAEPGVCKLPLGADCWYDDECEFDKCRSSQAFGAPGTCTCNPTLNSGCASGETCFSAAEQPNATGIVDVGPRCLLPTGSTCSDNFECLAGACVSGSCQVLSTGTQTTGSCSPVPANALCFAVVDPVKCGDCCYSNSCRAYAAGAADPAFDTSTCASPGDGECPDDGSLL